MKPLSPGQAALTRHAGKVCIVICDHEKNLTLGGVAFGAMGGIQRIAVAGILVPVVMVLIRLSAGGVNRTYVAWVNELEEGVIESLATQSELPVILASPLGKRIGSSEMENGLRGLSRKLGVISELAESARWGPHHFAAARAFIESQFPTADALWEFLAAQ